MVCMTTSILRLVALFTMAGAATAAAIGTAPTVAPLSVVKTGNFDVTVGGTLNVAADQENATYTGTFSVDMLYF
jgi:hypothetical protein